jgi:hypothetical protein
MARRAAGAGDGPTPVSLLSREVSFFEAAEVTVM